MKLLCLSMMIGLVSCVTREVAIERQMIGLLEKFDRWDLDGNGNLTSSELVDAEKLSGIPTANIIRFYDTNKNGKISLIEASAGISRMSEAQAAVSQMQLDL